MNDDLDSYEYNEPATEPVIIPPEEPAPTRRWLVLVVALLSALVVVIAGWLWSRRSTPTVEPAAEEQSGRAEQQVAVTTESIADDALELPALDVSDAIVRELAATLSAHPAFASWLVNEDLVRRFVVAVDNMAEGQSPRAHLEFIEVKGEFEVTEGTGAVAIDPAGFRRFDPLVEVFASLDSEGSIELYRRLEPLIGEAYRELGYPQQSFEDALRRAAGVVLDTPRVGGAIELRPAVRSYHFADEQLEQLDPLQKQLLRFGPENLARLQDKIRSLLRVLDDGEVAESGR